MTAQLLGGCACGAIRYACDVAPAAVFHCHCRDCQRSSGAPMSTVAVVPRTGFSLLTGRPRSYAVTSNSGNTMRREFCGDCGSPLFLDLGVRPDIWIIRATSFDDPGAFKPSMRVWTGSAQPWDRVNDGLTTAQYGMEFSPIGDSGAGDNRTSPTGQGLPLRLRWQHVRCTRDSC